MSEGSRRKILAGLGVAGALVTTTSTAAGALAAGKAGLFKGASGAAMKWVMISALVGLVPAGAWVAHSRLRAPEVVPSSQRASDPAGPERTSAKPAAPAKDPTSELLAPAEATPNSNKVAGHDLKGSPVQPSTLSGEVGALQVARNALARDDAAAALAALDRYKSRYPAGRLAPEATVLRIEALVARGDRAQASALAERFESSNPKSPYAERIRSILKARSPGAR